MVIAMIVIPNALLLAVALWLTIDKVNTGARARDVVCLQDPHAC